MKKIFLVFAFVLFVLVGYSQYPVTQNLGSPSTLVKNPNYGGFQGGLIPYTFADTTAANLTNLKYYSGALIYTSSPRAVFWRDASVSQWLQLLPSGGSTGTLAWTMGGNNPVVTDGSGYGLIGPQTNNGLSAITNNTVRFSINTSGAFGLGSGRDFGTSGYVLKTNGSGSSPSWVDPTTLITTPTWQQTLTAGSTLSADNLVNSSGYTFTLEDVKELNLLSSGATSYVLLSSTNGTISSELSVEHDSIKINPYLGKLTIDTLTNNVGTHALRYNPTTGLVSYADTTAGGGGGWGTTGTVATLTGNSTLALGGNSFAINDATNGDMIQLNPAGNAAQFLASDGNNSAYFSINGTTTPMFTLSASLPLTGVLISGNGNSGEILYQAEKHVFNNNGGSPDASSIVDIQSTTKGLLIPRMTETEKNAIGTPATGLMIFQTDGTSGFYYYDGAAWTAIGGGGWGTTGTVATLTGASTLATGGNSFAINDATNGDMIIVEPGNYKVKFNTTDATVSSSLELNSGNGHPFFDLNLFDGAAEGGINFDTLNGVIYGNRIAISSSLVSADSSAMLDISSTTKGLLIPRMTETERNAIAGSYTPAVGLTIFQTDVDTGYHFYTGNAWKQFTVNDQRLTSGRIPYVTTDGRLTDDANFTYNGADFDLTANSSINIRSTANSYYGDVANNIYFRSSGSNDQSKLFAFSPAIAAGSNGDALTVVDVSTGEIGVAPNLAFNLRKDSTDMYTVNGTIWVKDRNGNKTQISPHDDKGDWIYKSTDKNGVTTEINMIKLAELLERVSGEKLIYKTKSKK